MTLQGRRLAAGLSMLFLAGSATALRGQTLADVARKEEARRKGVKEPAKTYTNADLHSVPPATAQSTAPADAAKPAAPTAEADKDKKDAAKDPGKDKAFWSARMKELQSQLDRDQTYADALQTKINSLAADFVSRDDPAQRAQIARDKQKAMDELNRLKAAIQNDKKAISDLEEEARKAGVPPGWLRS